MKPKIVFVIFLQNIEKVPNEKRALEVIQHSEQNVVYKTITFTIKIYICT